MTNFRVFLLAFSLAAASAQARGLRFEFDRSEDRVGTEQRRGTIDDGAKRIEAFFKASDAPAVLVQVKDFASNPNFLNCATLTSRGSIYVHSPESLKQATPRINPICLQQSYDDLAETILHEYVHAVDRRTAPVGTQEPKWLWEGLAGHLSGQLDRGPLRNPTRKAIQSLIVPVDACRAHFTDAESYELGAALVRFYESKAPGVTLALRAAKSPADFSRSLKAHGLSCAVSAEQLLGAL